MFIFYTKQKSNLLVLFLKCESEGDSLISTGREFLMCTPSNE